MDSKAGAKLSANALRVLEDRYLLKDEKGNIFESPDGMFRRVARAVASAEEAYGRDARKAESEFYSLMSSLSFLPNSPTLMNAGTQIGQLSACFVVPVEDSIESIFDALKDMARIHQSGGGTGFSFSRLRPRGDEVKSTGGVASGPVSFMRVFDAATEVIKQGGRRRGANMGILRADHPDILEFISSKGDEKSLRNFNISVAVTGEFMEAVKNGWEYALVNPRTGKSEGKEDAEDVFEAMARAAWLHGDPGIIFIDEINRHNPTPALGAIEGTNPCGEQPLLPYESCNLGSVNLLAMTRKGRMDWEKLSSTVAAAVRFLDDVIDVNRFPLKEIEARTKRTRKIGLGVMGFADALLEIDVEYGSEDGCALGEKIMSRVSSEARKASEALGIERGSFPAFEESVWAEKYKAMRNATVSTIAPTGSISIIAGCSSGIEPLFALSYARSALEGKTLYEVNPRFIERSRRDCFYEKRIIDEVTSRGTTKDVAGIPEKVRRVYATAHEIAPERHVRMQAAFQKHTDNAVSKTVNLPNEASVEDVKKVFMDAYEMGCKGVTVYRYESRKEQVLSLGCPKNTCPT